MKQLDDGGGGDNWSYRSCKAPVKSSHQQTNFLVFTVFFTGRMPFLLPNQQCQTTEGKNITSHELVYPKLIWGLATLSLTTNSYWLPWRRVDMPLISPLMPVPQSRYLFNQSIFSGDYCRLGWVPEGLQSRTFGNSTD